MIQLTSKQKKLLKQARKGVYITSLDNEGRATLLYLADKRLCESRCDLGGDGFYKITNAGHSALSYYRQDRLRYNITTAIAVAALALAAISLAAQLGLISLQGA